MKGARLADVAAIQERVTAVLRSIPKEAFADSFQKLPDRCQQCVGRMAIILKANKVNWFVSSVLFVSWYHSPNFLDTPRVYPIHMPSSGIIPKKLHSSIESGDKKHTQNNRHSFSSQQICEFSHSVTMKNTPFLPCV
jgi:hypothetical protein